ncbi:hypothetical protein PLICRDRAFT_91227 [Plicaturopsis crispa FD-325 SS-3]|nr:hypothetical protein PLICRDRAFT_91227 [Plicaturopsis crispa FD-325 SS-3]
MPIVKRLHPTILAVMPNVDYGTLFVWKDAYFLQVVLAPHPDSYAARTDMMDADDLRFQLEVIQTLLHTLRFGPSAQKAILVGQPDGSYRPTYKKALKIQPLKSSIWAPLLDDSDVEVIKIMNSGSYIGLRNGMEVSVVTPLVMDGSSSVELCEEQVEGFRVMELAGLRDYTDKFLAHVVRDGQIMGYMTENANAGGRLIEPSDHTAIVEAFSHIQSRNVCLGPFPSESVAANLAITGNGLCVLVDLLRTARFIPDDDQLAKEALSSHWKIVEDAFSFPRWYILTTDQTISPAFDMPTAPSLGRVRVTGTDYHFSASWVEDDGSRWDDHDTPLTRPKRRRNITYRFRCKATGALAMGTHELPALDVGSSTTVALKGSQPLAQHTDVPKPLRHPYRRAGRSRKLLLAPEDLSV